MTFADRREAGQALAKKLAKTELPPNEDIIIYALPRGGVVLAFEIAKKLQAPVDLLLTRKIGHPMNPEYAVCAVAEHGEPICDEYERNQLDDGWYRRALAKERRELIRRKDLYLRGRRSPAADGKTVIIVDDGIATGLTMRAALAEVKNRSPARIILALTVIPRETFDELASEVDSIVALAVEEDFRGAIGAYYRDFAQVDDQEVIELLDKAEELA